MAGKRNSKLWALAAEAARAGASGGQIVACVLAPHCACLTPLFRRRRDIWVRVARVQCRDTRNLGTASRRGRGRATSVCNLLWHGPFIAFALSPATLASHYRYIRSPLRRTGCEIPLSPRAGVGQEQKEDLKI